MRCWRRMGDVVWWKPAAADLKPVRIRLRAVDGGCRECEGCSQICSSWFVDTIDEHGKTTGNASRIGECRMADLEQKPLASRERAAEGRGRFY